MVHIGQRALQALMVSISKKRDLVVLREGRGATIYRPNGTLFLLLKIARMNESDLLDCLQWMKWARESRETLDHARLLREISSQLRASTSDERNARLERLKKLLQSSRMKGLG